jgi:hypothetical protein
MTATMTLSSASVNGWDRFTSAVLTVEQESIFVGPSLVRSPDPSWTFTDAQGHFHAANTMDGDDPWPTIREVFGADDDDDPWLTAVGWECKLCSAEVEPAWVTKTTGNQHIPGRKSWEVELVSLEPHPDLHVMVSFRGTAGVMEVFGTGHLKGLGRNMTRLDGNPEYHYTVYGNGPLAQRSAT